MWVAYHSSDLFAEVTAVSMVSLFENNKSFKEIHVLYIERGMSEKSKQKLQQIADRYGRDLQFVSMPNWSEKLNIRLSTTKKGWLGFGYNRLFITELLPANVDRLLYLDSDTIIETDLTDYWNTDFEDNYLAGVDDCLSSKYRELVDLPENGVYCNSGVLLFNIKKWREDNVVQTFIDYIYQQNGYFVFNEQSILNHVFAGKIKIMPPTYNTVTILYELTYEEMMILRKPKNYSYSQEAYRQAKHEPQITHYTGLFLIPNRPWEEGSTHPHRDMFLYYREMTPWKDAPLMPDKRGKLLKIGHKICHMFPRRFMLHCISFVYNYLRVAQFKVKRHKFLKEGK